MCSGIHEADSFFVYNPNQPTMEVMNTLRATVDDSMSYTRETINSAQDVLMLTSMARRVCVRVGTRVHLILSEVEIPSQILFIYLVTVGAIIGKAISNETVILNFIHHKDGKK